MEIENIIIYLSFNTIENFKFEMLTLDPIEPFRRNVLTNDACPVVLSYRNGFHFQRQRPRLLVAKSTETSTQTKIRSFRCASKK